MAIGRRIADYREERRNEYKKICAPASGPGFDTSTNCSGNEIAYDESRSLEGSTPVLRATVPADRATSSTNLTSSSASMGSSMPPSYSTPARLTDEQAVTTSSTYSHDSSFANLLSSDGTSMVSADSTSEETKGIRIRTKGSKLKSGSPYHHALFELQVHPTMWDAFTTQLIDTTKFTLGDHAQVWAAAAGVACTGALVTSVLVGRGMGTRVQEKKVKSGLLDTSDDGLGATLQRWNDGYFQRKRAKGQPGAKRVSDEEWQESEQVDPEGSILVVEMPGDSPTPVVELSAAGDASVMEMPTDGPAAPAELPGDFPVPGDVSSGFAAAKWATTIGVAELDSLSTHLLESKLNSENGIGAAELEGDLQQELVIVKGDAHAALYNKTS
ncbi:hypothetical protein EJ03DRAFT_351571 [Teratosphaeria nubilosa]|uniref:Uncharacterized protein n=1 Tax=Teratosphaeria nubilosa TaxID=161662 RepID=A0A6G1L836_9PEZI|nr:hypothetical protein EJ03DRAFT_351571 [Teratosphaeria nubilosa]